MSHTLVTPRRGRRGRGAGPRLFGLLNSGSGVYSIIQHGSHRDADYPPGVRSANLYRWLEIIRCLAVYGYNHKKVKHEEDEFVG